MTPRHPILTEEILSKHESLVEYYGATHALKAVLPEIIERYEDSKASDRK